VLCCIDETKRITVNSLEVVLFGLDCAADDASVEIRFPKASYTGGITGGKYFTRAVDVFDT
jgi:hypothetical protein